MTYAPQLLLIGAVAAVGVLHTIVPDHWVPIALIARQRGWSKGETAWASLQAGIGHVLSTLVIAALVWLAGVALAQRFGRFVDTASSLALIAFGAWIALSAWRELRPGAGDDRGPDLGVRHRHRHAQDAAASGTHAHAYAYAKPFVGHDHPHGHGRADHAPHVHAVAAEIASAPPLHVPPHKTTGRTALLLVLGSSPMIEGIPAFFAAGRYGAGLVSAMAVVFALGTIATYVLLCVLSAAGLRRLRFGAIERYGEVLSGGLIAVVGLTFWMWSVR